MVLCRGIIDALDIVVVTLCDIRNDRLRIEGTLSPFQQVAKLRENVVICSNDSVPDVLGGAVVEDILGDMVSVHRHISQHSKPASSAVTMQRVDTREWS